MTRIRIALLALAIPLTAACSSEATTPAGAQATDAYAQYLNANPNGDLVLSRDDAQTRALLGCGVTWAPGTIDAVLAEAYGELCQ